MKLAYLFPTFPVFHQTFVLWEVLGLQRNGLDPLIYSLRRPGMQRQQPEARNVAEQVRYLPGPLSLPVLVANGRALFHSPRRWLGLWIDLIRAWRTGVTDDPGVTPGPGVPWADRLRAWIYRSPLVYLARSFLLVPVAVHLSGELQRAGVTHLHAHWATHPSTVAFLVSRFTGIPFSMSAHAYDIYRIQRMLPAKIRAARFLMTCARTNAEFLCSLVDEEAARKIRVSYHGVDVSRFAPAELDSTADRPFTVTTCGRLELYKGMRILVDACAELQRRGVDIECWIVGDGPQRAALQEQIDRLGLSDRVHLAGLRPHGELVERLRRSDAFALASEMIGRSRRRDVIANAIVEAMAVGIPVVASRVPGADELVEDEVNGLLVRPNRTDDLAEALLRLHREPELRRRLGRAGRERVLRDFDNGRNVRELARLFESLAGASPGAANADLPAA